MDVDDFTAWLLSSHVQKPAALVFCSGVNSMQQVMTAVHEEPEDSDL